MLQSIPEFNPVYMGQEESIPNITAIDDTSFMTDMHMTNISVIKKGTNHKGPLVGTSSMVNLPNPAIQQQQDMRVSAL